MTKGVRAPKTPSGRGRGGFVRAIPRGCAGPGGVASRRLRADVEVDVDVEAAPTAAARPRARFSFGLVASESPAEDPGLPASARPTNDTSMGSGPQRPKTMNTATPPGRTMPRDSPLGRAERGGYGMGRRGWGLARAAVTVGGTGATLSVLSAGLSEIQGIAHICRQATGRTFLAMLGFRA